MNESFISFSENGSEEEEGRPDPQTDDRRGLQDRDSLGARKIQEHR